MFAGWGIHLIVRFPKSSEPFAEALPPALTIKALNRTVTLDALEEMLTYLDQLVEDAHARFYPNPPAQHHEIRFETVRERDDGTWEHFDVGAPVKSSS